MKKELYSKSKKLGFDYLQDRTTGYVDQVQLNLVQELCYNIDAYSENFNFNFKKYMEICEKTFKSIEGRLEPYLNNDGYLIYFECDCDYDLFIMIDKYETEDEFIKRMKKFKKYKDDNSNKKINELTREASYLSKDERKKLIEEILNVK